MNVDSATKIVIAIAAMGALAVSTVSLIVSINNSEKISEVHISINSRMDQLLIEKSKSSRAEGVTQERARQDAVDEKSDNRP